MLSTTATQSVVGSTRTGGRDRYVSAPHIKATVRTRRPYPLHCAVVARLVRKSDDSRVYGVCERIIRGRLDYSVDDSVAIVVTEVRITLDPSDEDLQLGDAHMVSVGALHFFWLSHARWQQARWANLELKAS